MPVTLSHSKSRVEIPATIPLSIMEEPELLGLLQNQNQAPALQRRDNDDLDACLHSDRARSRRGSLKSYGSCGSLWSGDSFASWSRASSGGSLEISFLDLEDEGNLVQPAVPDDRLSLEEALTGPFTFCFSMSAVVGLVQSFPALSQNYFFIETGA